MTTAHVHDPLVGRVLDGRYQINRKIARGGMAMVYEATDVRLSRSVAVKVLHEGLGDDPEFLMKFNREARAAAKLSHPNVVAIFDQGTDYDRHYIVMEYVEGQTLRNYIGSHAALPVQRAMDLMLPVLAAIAAAHRAGIIHRDIKPENVLISNRGEVKVADFGLAKAISGDTVTASAGLVIGTVSYIPPEVVTYGPADQRSDVYSAGILLFELLTGQKPHQGDSPIQVAWAHCNKDVPSPSTLVATSWRDSRKGIPPYLDVLVRAATNRDPNQRLANAGVFFDHLRLASATFARGVMNDVRVDEEMRRIGDSFDEPTEMMDTPPNDGERFGGPWHSALVGITPVTPISPVDYEGAARFYNDLHPQKAPAEPMTQVLGTSKTRKQRIPQSATLASRRQPQPTTIVAAPRTKKPRKHRLRGLLVALALLTLIGGGVATAWYQLEGQYTTSPQMSGMTREQAQAAASGAKLSLTWSEAYSETAPAGVIISTDPDAGSKIKQNSAVNVVVSRGAERFAMPAVVGLSQDEAAKALDSSTISIGKVDKAYDETAAVGVVVSASQQPGAQLKRGTTVDLVVSQGPKPIDIVDYTGKKADEAKASISAAGFKTNAVEEHSDTVAAGVVIRQDPAKGQGKKGDTVTIVVSKGPVMVEIPATRGLKAADAKTKLEGLGFVVKLENTNNAPLGLVLNSNPDAGKQAPKGSTITLYVA